MAAMSHPMPPCDRIRRVDFVATVIVELIEDMAELGEIINNGKQTIVYTSGDFLSIRRSRRVEGKVGKSNGAKKIRQLRRNQLIAPWVLETRSW